MGLEVIIRAYVISIVRWWIQLLAANNHTYCKIPRCYYGIPFRDDYVTETREETRARRHVKWQLITLRGIKRTINDTYTRRFHLEANCFNVFNGERNYVSCLRQ